MKTAGAAARADSAARPAAAPAARRTPSRRGGLAAGLALAAAWAAPALACPVCYGEASGAVIDGTKLSVAFLGGLVYLLLFGGVGMAVMVRRRALEKMDPRHGLRLIDGIGGDGSGGDAAAGNDSAANDSTANDPAGPHPAAPQETSER